MDNAPEFTPLVLLVDDQEWTSRSIESILRPKGHVVLKAYTGQQALELVTKVNPDAVIIDVHLPDIDGIDLLRQLRQSPTIQPTTPMLMITASSVGKAERLEALGAGAWDILTHPVDPNELVLRMDTFVRAKQESDRTREEGLTDPSTGFYNVRGILKRAKEIGADAVRYDRPMACIALGPHVLGAEEPEQPPATQALIEEIARRVAGALRTTTRVSDTVGRLGPAEFVIVAPGTDDKGAVRLADRIMEAAEKVAQEQGLDAMSFEELRKLRAGFCAVRGSDPLSAEDLLLKATMALRRAQANDGSFRVRAYQA
jgi:PleD family two-component response regulator